MLDGESMCALSTKMIRAGNIDGSVLEKCTIKFDKHATRVHTCIKLVSGTPQPSSQAGKGLFRICETVI
jgi:hypothetical protein